MKPLYRELNTLRILPMEFLKNYGILLKWDAPDEEKLEVLTGYYNWSMGKGMYQEDGESAYKAFCLLGDAYNIQDYKNRVSSHEK